MVLSPLTRILLGLLCAILLASPATAQSTHTHAKATTSIQDDEDQISDEQEDATEEEDDSATDEEDQKEKKPEKTEDQKKAEAYEKAIKDLDKYEGSFNFYLRKNDILIELPESNLGKTFFLQATFATGAAPFGVQAGFPLGDISIDPFRWERDDKRILLVRPRLRFRWDDEDSLKTAAERSFPEATLGAFKIEQEHPEKKLLLINATALFYGNILNLNQTISAAMGAPYVLDREGSSVNTIKSFAENSVLRMKLHYISPKGKSTTNALAILLGLSAPDQLEDSRSLPLEVNYNMWYCKESDYLPRLSDPRIGYFTQDFYSMSKFLDTSRTQRYINRFNLKKKDPLAELSDPVKPIVWTIDSSVPECYRDAVKDGVLRWNKAFEEIGYRNAIVVQDPPEGEDYHHADGRYNVIRWTLSEDTAFAISLFRTDPFTGEILNASISVDANMIAAAVSEHRRYTPQPPLSEARALKVIQRNPEINVSPVEYLLSTDEELAAHKLHQHDSFATCRYAQGLSSSAAFGWQVLQATAGIKISKEAYSKEFVADVISHEVGHCLGLRHNFVASTSLTTDELADDKLTDKEGVSASVMDYVPVNIQAVLKGQGNFFTPTIGSYDKWAIKYGYMDIDSDTILGERPALLKLASDSGSPGHAFMTDEDADNFDPFVVRFDQAKDPIHYSELQVEAAQKSIEFAIESMPRKGESYADRTNQIFTGILIALNEGAKASRFVGGLQTSRNFKGDVNERPPLRPVDPNQQRQAMQFITKNILAEHAFDLPVDVMQTLALDPNDSYWEAPVRRIISSRQNNIVAMLMSAPTTDRISENSMKLGNSAKAYGLDEHYSMLLAAVFSEVGKDKSISPLRRDIQRFVTMALMVQAGAPYGSINEDVRSITSDALRRLSTRFGEQLKKPEGLDGISIVHLRDTKANIDRFLNRQAIQ